MTNLNNNMLNYFGNKQVLLPYRAVEVTKKEKKEIAKEKNYCIEFYKKYKNQIVTKEITNKINLLINTTQKYDGIEKMLFLEIEENLIDIVGSKQFTSLTYPNGFRKIMFKEFFNIDIITIKKNNKANYQYKQI
jgi:hypothetical protein